MEYNNTIYFENGIEHTLTEKELVLIKRLLYSAKIENGYEEELENLQNLFLEHLDWVCDFELSELNFIHVSDQKFMNISNHHFWLLGFWIYGRVILTCPFLRKQNIASQSIRFNDLLKISLVC